MINEALGLIEVIGYPTAIEAADQALKAASVKLASITKVDGGIMTVQILGDVGAVTAAVAAAGAAAARVGTIRATHVIPRVDTALFDTVLKFKTMPKHSTDAPRGIDPKRNLSASSVSSQTQAENAQPIKNIDVKDETSVKEQPKDILVPQKMSTSKEIEVDRQSLEENKIKSNKNKDLNKKQAIDDLVTKSNSELRTMITQKGIDTQGKPINTMKKQELIEILTNFYKAEEGEI